LHTSDCAQTINRVIDVFPAHQQQQVRTQLSFVLQGVFCQQLIPRKNNKGRVLAAEIMIVNSAIRSLVRDDKVHQIYNQIQVGGKQGMRTMNQSIFDLLGKHEIDKEEALSRSGDPEDLLRMLQKYGQPS